MKLPLLGPSDLLGAVGAVRDAAGAVRDAAGAARDAAGAVRDSMGAAIELVPRIGALIGQAELLLARVDAVVSAVEVTVTDADTVLDQVHATQRRTDDAVAGAQGLVNRTDSLLTAYEPSLRRLAPVLERLAQSTSPDEVSAGISLIDRLPVLIEHVDETLLPLLSTLDGVGPDLHELLEVTQDLRRVITGLPGVGFLRRRGDDEMPSEQPPA